MLGRARLSAVLLVVAGTALCGGCGGSSHPGGLTKAQAQSQARSVLARLISGTFDAAGNRATITKLTCRPQASDWACPFTLSIGYHNVIRVPVKAAPIVTNIPTRGLCHGLPHRKNKPPFAVVPVFIGEGGVTKRDICAQLGDPDSVRLAGEGEVWTYHAGGGHTMEITFRNGHGTIAFDSKALSVRRKP